MGKKNKAEEGDKHTVVTLVHKCSTDRWTTAHPVPRKGNEPWSIAQTALDLGLWNYTSFVYKSDQEPSILLLKREVVQVLRAQHGPFM